MYRTRIYRIKKSNRLASICRDLCKGSAMLYSRANYLIRQYATAVRNLETMKPLYPNQMDVYRFVASQASGTKYESKGKWLSYQTLDYLLKSAKDQSYCSMPSQANQQILKLLIRDYSAFFEALKVYQSDPSRFTGRPHLPGYAKSLKTAVLTNQICAIKDGHFLKFPKTKLRLNLGAIPRNSVLQEVRIKPTGNGFEVSVVLSVPDVGIFDDPDNEKDYLAELSEMENIDNLRVLSIDPGTNNIAAIVNNFGVAPMLINGRAIKAINQWYNKELARLKSAATLCNDMKTTKGIRAFTAKRNRRIRDAFHKISRMIADYALNNKVNLVILGHNTFQKQEINIGRVNNQNFVQIPFRVFADMLRYKLNAYGIHFVCTEESYTSKADFLAGDELPEYRKDDDKKHIFSGKRIKRGLYKHYDGTITNADINGAGNIMRKVFPKVVQWDRGIVDMPCWIIRDFSKNPSCRLVA